MTDEEPAVPDAELPTDEEEAADPPPDDASLRPVPPEEDQ